MGNELYQASSVVHKFHADSGNLQVEAHYYFNYNNNWTDDGYNCTIHTDKYHLETVC